MRHPAPTPQPPLHARRRASAALLASISLMALLGPLPAAAQPAGEPTAQVDPAVQLAADFAAEQAHVAALSARTDADSALELGRLLKDGLRVSAENPLRRPDPAGAEAAFRRAVAAGGTAGTRARVELARLLSDSGRTPAESQEAATLFEAAAEAGNGAAATELGRLVEDGTLVPRDPERARELYTAGLAAGEPDAAFGLARLAGDGAPEEAQSYTTQGIMLLRRRAARSSGAAFALAERYAKGDGLARDDSEALALAESAIRQGRGADALALATSLLLASGSDGAARARQLVAEAERAGSTAAARLLLSDAAEDGPLGVDAGLVTRVARHVEEIGDARGMFVAAGIYQSGRIVPADGNRSAALFERVLATARDNPADLVHLGRMLADGDGVEADPARAYSYLRAAAEAGNAEGMLAAAELALDSASGLPPDEAARAIVWLQGAVQADQERAFVLLGDAYRDGRGVESSVARAGELYDQAIERHGSAMAMERRANLYLDYAASTDDGLRAIALLDQAAEAGRPSAMVALAKQYRYGRYIPKDFATAEHWLSEAAKAGYGRAYLELGDLYEKSPPPVGSPEKARTAYRQAWDSGEAEGGLRLGRILQAEGDTEAARQLLEQSLARGNGAAAVELAAAALQSGDRQTSANLVDQALTVSSANANAGLDVAAAIVSLPDPDLARRGISLLEELDRGGDGAATRMLAEIYGDGRLGSFDLAAATDWARRAAARGAVQPLFALASAMMRGDVGIDKDVPRAVALLEEAHKLVPTHMQTILALAKRYQTGGDGVAQDVQRAFALFQSAAQFGSTTGQVLTARAYADGSGTARDPAQAIQWFTRAADQGSLEAMMELGRYYAAGEGVKLDAEQAFGFFYRAAEGGSAEAMVEVGKSMLVGYGTSQDVPRGIEWLEKAAGTGSAAAMYDLFQLYNLDDPKLANPDKALHWIHEAVDHGSAEAAFRLALLYRDGKLVPKDEAQMRLWLQRAVEAGHAYSGKLLARMDRATAAAETSHE